MHHIWYFSLWMRTRAGSWSSSSSYSLSPTISSDSLNLWLRFHDHEHHSHHSHHSHPRHLSHHDHEHHATTHNFARFSQGRVKKKSQNWSLKNRRGGVQKVNTHNFGRLSRLVLFLLSFTNSCLNSLSSSDSLNLSLSNDRFLYYQDQHNHDHHDYHMY